MRTSRRREFRMQVIIAIILVLGMNSDDAYIRRCSFTVFFVLLLAIFAFFGVMVYRVH